MTGWILDKSAVVRAADPIVARQLDELAGDLVLCPIGLLEQLYSARSARDYDRTSEQLQSAFEVVDVPPNLLSLALELQGDLARHHGMWHRVPIPDLLTAVTALHHDLGVVHVDRDYDRIAEVRPLRHRRLRTRR
ncbi:MAG TPA: PIN domain-containing protein [Mycobacteriales bacterium]|nr:PIN domain-containing protein [Mycobacteriales bacterium]